MSWYGWQTLLSDLVAMAFISAAGAASGFGVLGVATLWLGPGIIHLAHGNIAAGIVSPIVRVLSSLAIVAGIGEAVAAADDEDGSDSGGVLLPIGAIGLVGTMIADLALLSWEDTASEPGGGATVALFAAPSAGAGGVRLALRL